jgi:cytochrome c-type biogenesis protein CcmF
MIANLGNYCLFASLLIGILISITNIISIKLRHNIFDFLPIFFHSLIIFIFLIMAYLFIVSDMKVVSVLLHSSSLLDFKYKIAGTWGSHETSTLFWAMINSVVYLIFDYTQRNSNLTVDRFTGEPKIIKFILNMLQTFFVGYLFCFSNPFLQISTTPNEGMGMNPSLQDMGMMIHPPMLFISYSIYMVIYAATIASLYENIKNDKIDVRSWSSFGFAFITMSVGLGGWWAYRELGWGGYWFFDPVENISLLVWLFGISLHHTLLQKNMNVSKFLFGIAPFISAIFGTFLVRSGMLTSVHSFAESGGSKAILAFAIFLLILPAITLILKHRLLNHTQEDTIKYYLMQSANMLWSTSGVIIIISLIIPIFSEKLIGDIIEIKPDFFIITIIPLMLISSLLAGIIYFNRNGRKVILAILLNLPSIPISIYYFHSSNIIAFSYFVGLVVVSCSIYRLYERYIAHSLNIKTLSMLLAHFAAGLFILSCAINNNFTISQNIVFNLHETAKLHANISVKLADIKYSNGKNYIRQIAYLEIFETDNNGKRNEITVLKPELRFYPIEQTLSSEVDIFSYITTDWYGVINNIDKERISVIIIYNPAISFIWLSVILCVFAILLPRIVAL